MLSIRNIIKINNNQLLYKLSSNLINKRLYCSESTTKTFINGEGEEESFDWLNKRSNKKVSTVKDIIEQQKEKENIKKLEKINLFDDQTKNFFKDKELKDEIEKARIEVEKNEPVDRKNLTIATLVRVCGKLTSDRDIVQHLIKRLIQFKEPITINHCHQLMQEYTRRGSSESIVENIFKLIIDNKIIQQINNNINNSNNYSNNIQPTIESFNLILQCYANNGSIDKCQSLIKEMNIRVEPNDITYFILVEGLSNSNRPEDAMKLLNEYLDGEKINDQLIRTKAFNSILSCYARQGSIQPLAMTIDTMTKWCDLDCLTQQYLIECLIKCNRVDQAVELVEHMDSDGIPTTTLTFYRLFEALARINQPNEITRLFEMLTRPSKPIVESLPPVADDFFNQNVSLEPSTNWMANINTYNSLVECYCRCNQLDLAFSTLDKMKSINIQPTGETFSSLEALAFKLDRMNQYNKYCGDEFHIIKKSDD